MYNQYDNKKNLRRKVEKENERRRKREIIL